MTTDERIAVVAAVLGDEWRHRFGRQAMAEDIVAALDERAFNTKWEGPREKALKDVVECWIPHKDLLEYLNTLPGAPLTLADLRAKLRAKLRDSETEGDPKLQADCLRVFKREQRAGTDFPAIVSTIGEEVLGPDYDRRREQEDARKTAQRSALVASGRDFGFVANLDPNSADLYSRQAGQLYRLHRVATNQHALFRVGSVGETGTPANPHIFRRPAEAREAVRARRVK
jgi:hypothetical protein